MREKNYILARSISLFGMMFLLSWAPSGAFAADEAAAAGAESTTATSTSTSDTASIEQYLEQALPENPGRKVVYDELTGVLTITDTPTNQQMAKELVKLWDIGPTQVRIQARFVEVQVTNLQELGVEWEARRQPQGDGINKNTHWGGFGGNFSSGTLSEDATTAGQMFQANETSGIGLTLGKLTATGDSYFVYLKALIEEGKANLLSSPSVTTLSGQMANIQMANIVPYASDFTRTNIGSANFPVMVEIYKVAEKVTGISLEVTPSVAGDSKVVTMDIHPEVSVLVNQIPISSSTDFPAGLGYPVIDTRTTQTSVVIKSGETVVLGGLIREDEKVTKRKVPILGDIPLVGNLFKSDHTDKIKKNLLIFLTATILNSKGEPVL